MTEFMTELMQFLLNHWVLASVLGLVLTLQLINEGKIYRELMGQLNAQEVIRMMNHNQAMIIDIRDQESFEAGHIVGALNVSSVKDGLGNKVDKQKSIIIVDTSGAFSLAARTQLKKAGYTQVYFLAKGMAAWEKDNLPVVKK